MRQTESLQEVGVQAGLHARGVPALRHRVWYGVALTLVAFSVATSAGQAQTLFAWPKATSRDFAQYKDLDMCLTFAVWLRDSVRKTDHPVRDTGPERPEEWPQSVHVHEQVSRCAGYFPPRQDSMKNARRVFQLYLIAGRDSNAAQLVTYRLGRITGTDSAAQSARAAELGEWGSAWLAAGPTPTRVAQSDSLLAAAVRLGGMWEINQRIKRLHGYWLDMVRAGDTTRARRAATWLTEIPKTVRPEDRARVERFDQIGRRNEILDAALYLRELEMQDSLARSTAAYVKFLRTTWAQMMGKELTEGPATVYGTVVPMLKGEWLFPHARVPEAKHVPIPGKINVVVAGVFRAKGANPLNDTCVLTEACIGDANVLRRLGQRFPDVAINIVVKTAGVLGTQAYANPEDEAQGFKALVDAKGIPATVLVSNTKFTRLADPDRRRIDDPEDPNVSAYTFHASAPASVFNVFITDRNGAVVYALFDLNRRNEREVIAILTALQKQPPP